MKVISIYLTSCMYNEETSAESAEKGGETVMYMLTRFSEPHSLGIVPFR